MSVNVNQPEPGKQNITEMLRQWSDGKRKALDELMPPVGTELRRRAARFLRRERHDQTLQKTALIHEAYLKLINQRDVNRESRTHFFCDCRASDEKAWLLRELTG